jgi:hypothetical protein
MSRAIPGLHHVTAISGPPQVNHSGSHSPPLAALIARVSETNVLLTIGGRLAHLRNTPPLGAGILYCRLLRRNDGTAARQEDRQLRRAGQLPPVLRRSDRLARYHPDPFSVRRRGAGTRHGLIRARGRPEPPTARNAGRTAAQNVSRKPLPAAA